MRSQSLVRRGGRVGGFSTEQVNECSVSTRQVNECSFSTRQVSECTRGLADELHKTSKLSQSYTPLAPKLLHLRQPISQGQASSNRPVSLGNTAPNPVHNPSTASKPQPALQSQRSASSGSQPPTNHSPAVPAPEIVTFTRSPSASTSFYRLGFQCEQAKQKDPSRRGDVLQMGQGLASTRNKNKLPWLRTLPVWERGLRQRDDYRPRGRGRCPGFWRLLCVASLRPVLVLIFVWY